MPFIRVTLSSAGTLLMFLLSYCDATESRVNEKVFLSDFNCPAVLTNDCCPFESLQTLNNFKAFRSSDTCSHCPAGYFVSRTEGVNCTRCPAKCFCKDGPAKPLLCESYYVCPLGSKNAVECDPSWNMETEGVNISTTLIVIICVITIPIVVAVFALIIYKLCRYCRRRRHTELCNGETDPLLPGGRHGSHVLQEPVYTGL